MLNKVAKFALRPSPWTRTWSNGTSDGPQKTLTEPIQPEKNISVMELYVTVSYTSSDIIQTTLAPRVLGAALREANAQHGHLQTHTRRLSLKVCTHAMNREGFSLLPSHHYQMVVQQNNKPIPLKDTKLCNI